MSLFKQINIKSIIAIVAVMLFVSCENKLETIEALTQKTPSNTAENITIIRTDSGKIVGKIFAPKLIKIFDKEKPYTEFPKGLTAESYTNYPVIESSLTCKYAKNFEDKNLWLARYKVVVVNNEGARLETEELYWDTEKEQIYTEKDVRITKGNEIMYGKGLTSDQEFKNYEIKQPKGTFYIEDNE